MAKIRKPFQGVLNIIRFNWHFYVFAIVLLYFLFFISKTIGSPFQNYLQFLCYLIALTTVVSLIASFYVYDLSGFYDFEWMETLKIEGQHRIVNINAGFDETSELIKTKFVHSDLMVLDFYDPLKHTEVSIERARKAYPPYPNTQQVKTNQLPFADQSVDLVFAILSAHEIRDEKERIIFFKELNRIIKSNGRVVVTEHLQNSPNFIAYNIGFFHFHSKSTWLKTFKFSDLMIKKEIKNTPLMTTFILEKNGTTD